MNKVEMRKKGADISAAFPSPTKTTFSFSDRRRKI
jgi:hypothetical protein